MLTPPAPAAPAEPPLQRPAGLPTRFTLLRRLGQGASGTVYAAHDEGREALVALKLVPLAQQAGDEGGDAALGTVAAATLLNHLHTRFAAEAATAQRLHHPDIVATLDAGSAGNLGWLVMELVPGTPLSRYTHPARLLPEALALQAVARIAGALAHAHRQGVVHRDVKPANVLVHWPGGLCKLGDFGLARGVDSEATRTGLVLGSPVYMAPELLAGAPPSSSSDLYALGVSLFQLLTGQLPFDTSSVGQLLREVARTPAPALGTLRPDLPAELDVLLAQLLAKRAGERPADGDAVAGTLRAIAERWPAPV
jgi:serine/threonine protein kinase